MFSSHPFIASLKYSVLGVLLASSAHSAVTVVDSSTLWNPIQYGNTPDAPDDHQTGGAEADLVGSITVPFFYTVFDDANPGDLTDGTLSFRTRHGGDSASSGFDAVLFIGIDADNDFIIDAYVGIDNRGSTNDIFIATAEGGANNSISTLSIGDMTTFSQTSTTYDWREVNNSDEPGDSLDIDGDLTAKANDDQIDYYLSFQIDFNTLVQFLEDEAGITGVDQTTGFGYVVGTTSNPNVENQDIGGIDGNDDNFDPDTPFVDLVEEGGGGTSTLTTPTGVPIPIPEPSTSLLLLLGLLSACSIRRK